MTGTVMLVHSHQSAGVAIRQAMHEHCVSDAVDGSMTQAKQIIAAAGR